MHVYIVPAAKSLIYKIIKSFQGFKAKVHVRVIWLLAIILSNNNNTTALLNFTSVTHQYCCFGNPSKNSGYAPSWIHCDISMREVSDMST